MKCALLILVAILSLNSVAFAQDNPRVFKAGEVSRFDSLVNSGSHIWNLANIGGSALPNLKTRLSLAKIYPEGVTWERTEYEGEKWDNTTDRWFVVKDSTCFVYELIKWNYGGVFVYLNGVNLGQIDEFNRLLKQEIGKPVEFHD